ncbi:MAG: hypothetical protein Q8867_06600, partial [Bacteroidota bacterium]|nr:hypothetical protein [Bacteroidota bacterium]
MKMENRKYYHRKIFYFLSLAIVFLIPVYGRIIPALIALMVLNWLIEGEYIHTIPGFFHNKKRWQLLSFSILFLLYLLGMIYSRNVSFGLFDLQIKLSLLIFPLVLSTQSLDDFDIPSRKDWLLSFLAGCMTGCLILLIHAFGRYIRTGEPGAFYYTHLSWYMHSSYMSMYLSFATAVIGFFLIEFKEKIKRSFRIILYATAILFLIVIILISSKAGLISLSLVIISWVMVLAFEKKQKIAAVAVLVVSAFLIAGCIKLFPFVSGRIETT